MFTSYNEIIQWDQIPLVRHNEEQRNERINFHRRIYARYLETEGLRFSPLLLGSGVDLSKAFAIQPEFRLNQFTSLLTSSIL